MTQSQGLRDLTPNTTKILLLEGIADTAYDAFLAAGYRSVERRPGGMDEDELIDALDGVHVLGVRSRTQVSKRVLAKASSLASVGCFSVGTNQVALDEARLRGVPVFNAPFSNTRSVAELTIAEIVMLFRRLLPRAVAAESGAWQKSAVGSHEIRGKSLGIIGYGNVGSQLANLAEAMGMRVLFYDVSDKLRHGNAVAVSGLEDLLCLSDVVSLHVPETPATRGMIGRDEIALMPHGAFLINNARGDVIDVEALRDALASGHLAGAAVDVFPVEPTASGQRFESPLQGLDNVILTPHIGGSTIEAQERIGEEVARKLVAFQNAGSTQGAVNFPELALKPAADATRIVQTHAHAAGVLGRLIALFDAHGAAVTAQHFQTDGKVSYTVIDTAGRIAPDLAAEVAAMPSALHSRAIPPSAEAATAADPDKARAAA